MRAFNRLCCLLTMGLLLGPSMPLAAQRGFGGNAGPRAQRPDSLRFRYLGPASAGRFASITGVPGDTMTYYLGAASGGVWKTTDKGETFEPLFDDQPVQAIGALAVAPSNPQIVWAGTGEAWAIRDADVMGDGIYKSTDGGATWTNMGLRETGRIGRVIVHPTNPDIVFACALGRTTGPQEERGVFRTTDGGRTWQRVLFVDPDTGCSGLAMDANNPDVLFAGTWDVVMHTWGMFSGGPGSGVYVSRDGGTRWTRIEDPGLPTSPVGKIDVAVASSNSQRVYALIQTADQGSVWRSDDGGRTWRVVSWDRTLIGRAGYYIRIAVNPANPDEVLVMNSSSHRSVDGGLTFPLRAGGCGDCHDVWMDPLNPDHWAVTGDQGAGFTRDHGENYQRVRLPIGQMYHLAVDTRAPYWVYSNRQDDGTMRGQIDSPVEVSNVPSYAPPRSQGGPGGGFGGFRGGGSRTTPWQGGIGGCESGFTLPDPRNADIVWATCYGNKITRYDDRTGRARSVAVWLHTLDAAPTQSKYRCHWTPPLALDPFDPETVYYGCQVVFQTSDRGTTWREISPDLSTQDSSRIVSSGGIIGDNLGQFVGEVVFAIAPSPIREGLIWAGTNDGKIWYTTDRGGRWTDVTTNVQGMPEWGTIRKIEPSTFDANTAYVAVDLHLMDNRDPYIYKTTDLGRTWTNVTGDLPTGHPLDYVMAVTENPNRRGMLFAGTGHGFYYSMDDGGHWTQFREGLPAAPVSWVVVEPRYHDVVVSTYGRGLFALRDITRLEQADRVPANAEVYLYEPRPGFREERSGEARFLFSLPRADSVRLSIADESGSVVRDLDVGAMAGLNEVTWDLRHESPRQIALRTIPPDNPHIWEEARFQGEDTRPIVHWGIGSAMRAGPIAAPGDYTVRLIVDGRTYERPFVVLKDPEMPSSAADLAASTEMQARIRDDMNTTVDLVNQLEVMRKQIEDLTADHEGEADLVGSLAELDQKMMDVELRLLSHTELHSDDKWYVEAYKVYLNLIWLYGEVGLGASDVAGGADYRPTNTSYTVLALLEEELAAAEAAFRRLVDEEVPAFNRRMSGRLPAIVVSATPPISE